MRVRASLPDFLERLLVSLWAGAIWSIGFLVAPMLFRISDDRLLAGRLAGAMFETLGWLGLVCGTILLALVRFRPLPGKQAKTMILLAMLVLTAIGQFVLYPEMGTIRDTAGALSSGPGRNRFLFLHGLASTLFLANSVLAAVLIWFQSAPRD